MNKHSRWVLSQADPRPLYLQVMEQIRWRVAVGDLAPGEELPSIRQLAADLGVSVITIKRAYLELEHEGVILTRQGKGSFIAQDAAVGPKVGREELGAHLAEVAKLAHAIGLTKSELQKSVSAAYDREAGK